MDIGRAGPTDCALVAQVRECFGRVVYSHKTHEKAADQCQDRLAWIKGSQIVLSAITTGGLITALLGKPSISPAATVVAAIVSTMLLALNAYVKDVDPGQQAEKHRKTASELWDIRESYLSLLSDLEDGSVDLANARAARDALQERLAKVYAVAPRTTPDAYAKASVGLKKNEELTFSDAEIDQFLPTKLRKGSN
jgi:hypothetical protein